MNARPRPLASAGESLAFRVIGSDWNALLIAMVCSWWVCLGIGMASVPPDAWRADAGQYALYSAVAVALVCLTARNVAGLRLRKPFGASWPDYAWALMYRGAGSVFALGIAVQTAYGAAGMLRTKLFATPLESLAGAIAIGAGLLMGLVAATFILVLPRWSARASLAGRLPASAICECLWVAAIGWTVGTILLFWPEALQYFAGCFDLWWSVAVFVFVRLMLARFEPKRTGGAPLVLVMLASRHSTLARPYIAFSFPFPMSFAPMTLLAPASLAREFHGAHSLTAARAGCLDTLFPGARVDLERMVSRLPPPDRPMSLPARECYPADTLWAESLQSVLTPESRVVLIAFGYDPALDYDANARVDALRPVLPLARTIVAIEDVVPSTLADLHLGTVRYSHTSRFERTSRDKPADAGIKPHRQIFIAPAPGEEEIAERLLRTLRPFVVDRRGMPLSVVLLNVRDSFVAPETEETILDPQLSPRLLNASAPKETWETRFSGFRTRLILDYLQKRDRLAERELVLLQGQGYSGGAVERAISSFGEHGLRAEFDRIVEVTMATEPIHGPESRVATHTIHVSSASSGREDLNRAVFDIASRLFALDLKRTSLPSPAKTSAGQGLDGAMDKLSDILHHAKSLDNALPAGAVVLDATILGPISNSKGVINYVAIGQSLMEPLVLEEYFPSMLAARQRSAGVMVGKKQTSSFFAGLSIFDEDTKTLRALRHDCLPTVRGFARHNGTAYRTRPYYDGSSLEKTLSAMKGPPDQAWLRAVFTPLFEALLLLHASECTLGNISPSNVMLRGDTGAPILLAFDPARDMPDVAASASLDPYRAPYVPDVGQPDAPPKKRNDIYSVAAIMYRCMAGKPPPPARRTTSYEPIEALLARRYSSALLRAIDDTLAGIDESEPRLVSAREFIDLLARDAESPRERDAKQRTIAVGIAVVVAAVSATSFFLFRADQKKAAGSANVVSSRPVAPSGASDGAQASAVNSASADLQTASRAFAASAPSPASGAAKAASASASDQNHKRRKKTLRDSKKGPGGS